MITRIESLRFRCLRYVSQAMGRFHVIVGPNASGKTTFLDIVGFLGSLVADGLDEAIGERTQSFEDHVWRRRSDSFELAIELEIPENLREHLNDPGLDTVRYEVAIGLDKSSNSVMFQAETVLLLRAYPERDEGKELFPNLVSPPQTILLGVRTKGIRTVINKARGGNDNFYSETYSKKGKGWVPAFKLGPRRSALANLPEDETRFPVATWLKEMLANGIRRMMLNSLVIRRASPAGKGRDLKPDGGNLPWVVNELAKRNPKRLDDWIAHLQTALPDLEGIRTGQREDDRSRYLMLRYSDGVEVPSWMASDGTLRLLALTLPAYLDNVSGIYLIEEPENGVHPRAVETMLQSLSSMYSAQVLLATHSPVVLGVVKPEQLLCFAKDEDGATDIVLGSEHPMLREWRRETSLSMLFAAGVLG